MTPSQPKEANACKYCGTVFHMPYAIGEQHALEACREVIRRDLAQVRTERDAAMAMAGKWRAKAEEIVVHLGKAVERTEALVKERDALHLALREIACGNTSQDDDSPLGWSVSMAGRLVDIAQCALKARKS